MVKMMNFMLWEYYLNKKVKDLSMDLDVESKEKKGVKDGGWNDGVAVIWDRKVCDGNRFREEVQGFGFGQKFEM